MITMFDSPTYYLVMSIIGWLLVLGQITVVVWVYKKLRKKRPIRTAGDQ